MLKYICPKGLQYEGETLDDMERREKAMEEHNRKIDELYADWKRQRATPMPSMVAWAREHGLLK